MRLHLAAILIPLLCVVLAACGELPRPFKPAEKSGQTWAGTGIDAGLDTWGSVLVRPVKGLPPPLAAALAAETVGALLVREVPASERSASRASITLSGRIGVASGTLHWTLDAPDGETVARFDEPRPGKAWREATEPELEAVARRAASWVEAALVPPRGILAGARKTAPVVVTEVSGAPGGGGPALARAMRRSLARIGIATAPAEDRAALRISGRVSIVGDGDAPEGADITIAWRVLQPDGAEIGIVTQSNRVPAEILEGRWGPAREGRGAGRRAGDRPACPARIGARGAGGGTHGRRGARAPPGHARIADCAGGRDRIAGAEGPARGLGHGSVTPFTGRG